MNVVTISAIVAAIIQGLENILGKLGLNFSAALVIILTVVASVGVTAYEALANHLAVLSLATLVVLIQVIIGAVGGNVIANKTLTAFGVHK